jgi:hypothetical protein
VNALRNLVQGVKDDCWHRAAYIRNDVAANRLTYRDEGSLAWDVDDFRLAWADLLEALSGWAQ